MLYLLKINLSKYTATTINKMQINAPEMLI